MKKFYIIAEIGNNHNGKKNKAIELIDAAYYAGADAVKFQSFRGIDIVNPKVKSSDYPNWAVGNYKYWYEFLDSIALKFDDHQDVINYAKTKGLDFITTPLSDDVVNFLEKLTGIYGYKIASMDLTNKLLIKSILKTNKNIFLSTGMSSLLEIKKTVKLFDNRKLNLLHCISDYPLKPEDAHLQNLVILKEKFPKVNIGFSNHYVGVELDIAAACLGSVIFEKHITLNRNDTNIAEHFFSLEPEEFKDFVNWIRIIEKDLNNKKFDRSTKEIRNKNKYRRSLFYKNDIKTGVKIKISDLLFVRPATGIDYETFRYLKNKTLKKDVYAFQPCKIEHFI